MKSFLNQPYRQSTSISISILQTVYHRLILCHKTADLPYQLRKLRWLIAKRDLSQLRIPAVQHDGCVGFLMQVNPHINDVLFSQMSSFLLFLSPSVTAELPATSADKRYVPVYALGYGHRKGE